MPASFVVVPQWQGSGSSRAMRLVDGAEAIRGDLPAASTRLVDVPLESGDARGTDIARFGSLLAVTERMTELLADTPYDDWVLTIGGDCGVEIAAIDHARSRHDDLAVVWFDAHPDLNSVEESESHAFTGMVLRALTGDGEAGLTGGLSPSRIVLAGTRALDLGEELYIAAENIPVLGVEALGDPAALVAAVTATGATSVYVHIDLDVLDPSQLLGLGSPVPFGLETAALVELIRALKQSFTLAGAGITEFAPANADEAADDMPSILRIIGALTK